METSQPISIESFSYSWLVNIKPSLEPSNSDIEANCSSFIEMDPRMPPSKRFFRRNSQDNFKFDFPIMSHDDDDDDGSSMALVDADELFSNGYLTPLFLHSLKKMDHHQEAPSPSSSSINSHNNNIIITNPISNSPSPKGSVGPTIPHSSSSAASRCPSLKRCRTVSRRVFQKYLNFLRPLCRKLRGLNQKKSSSSSNHHHELVGAKRSCSEISPRISVAYSADEYWRKSCDSETSIYEAVLHCKRSIERRS